MYRYMTQAQAIAEAAIMIVDPQDPIEMCQIPEFNDQMEAVDGIDFFDLPELFERSKLTCNVRSLILKMGRYPDEQPVARFEFAPGRRATETKITILDRSRIKPRIALLCGLEVDGRRPNELILFGLFADEEDDRS